MTGVDARCHMRTRDRYEPMPAPWPVRVLTDAGETIGTTSDPNMRGRVIDQRTSTPDRQDSPRG